MTPSPQLSIVFLNYNRLPQTRQTCETLLQIIAERGDIEIIAVDNGSSDGTREYLQQLEHKIQLVLLTDNKGIAGYNRGFERAQGKYLLVLDDDSSPENIKTLEQGCHHLDAHEQCAIVACHIKTPDGQAQWSWHLPRARKTCPSPFFIGCGFFIRRQVFKDIGWYPDDFFLYQNEIDVAFKVYQRGFGIDYLPDCQVIHRGCPGQRPGWRRVFYPTRNTLWLIRRYYPPVWAQYMMASRLLIGFVRALQFGQIKAFWQAAKAGLFQPLEKNILDQDIHKKTHVFFRQNSIVHQILGWAD